MFSKKIYFIKIFIIRFCKWILLVCNIRYLIKNAFSPVFKFQFLNFLSRSRKLLLFLSNIANFFRFYFQEDIFHTFKYVEIKVLILFFLCLMIRKQLLLHQLCTFYLIVLVFFSGREIINVKGYDVLYIAFYKIYVLGQNCKFIFFQSFKTL